MAQRPTRRARESTGRSSTRLDDQLCFALYAATHRIQRLYRPLLDRLDLTYPQYLVLLVLWEDDDLIVTNIGQRLSLNSATLTPLLKRMEAADLIERRRSTEDGRKVTISLRPKGWALQKDVEAIAAEVAAAAANATPDAVALRETLSDLRDALPDQPGVMERRDPVGH
ncbi:MAG: MarR family transcriptional regulator [Actinomycetota bacterium]